MRTKVIRFLINIYIHYKYNSHNYQTMEQKSCTILIIKKEESKLWKQHGKYFARTWSYCSMNCFDNVILPLWWWSTPEQSSKRRWSLNSKTHTVLSPNTPLFSKKYERPKNCLRDNENKSLISKGSDVFPQYMTFWCRGEMEEKMQVESNWDFEPWEVSWWIASMKYSIFGSLDNLRWWVLPLTDHSAAQ